MLPLSYSDDRRSFINQVKDKINGYIRLIFSDRNSRNLFIFFLINFSFAFVELLYGIWSNSLGLISDAFHMFFDCSGLILGLVASVIMKWKANEKFSYGYVRVEVLTGFVQSLFLIFIALFIMSHAVERLVEPPEIKHDRLFLVSVGGLVVNLVGIFVFQHGHGHSHGGGGGHNHSHGYSPVNNHDSHFELNSISHGQNHNHNHNHDHKHGHSHFSHGHSHDSGKNSQIMRGVFLHVLADTLGSVGVIISTVLMQTFGWMIADPICSICIAVLIFVSVYDLIKESYFILMQRTPVGLDHVLLQCYQKVTQIAGVYSIQEPHFWTLYSDVHLGALKLEVSKSADPKYVVSQTHKIFASVGIKQLYVQLDYTIV